MSLVLFSQPSSAVLPASTIDHAFTSLVLAVIEDLNDLQVDGVAGGPILLKEIAAASRVQVCCTMIKPASLHHFC